MISDELRREIAEEVTRRFLTYVQIPSASDPFSSSVPSTAAQWAMLEQVAGDLRSIGVDVEVDRENAYVYGTLLPNAAGTPFGIGAHVDTSPDQSGDGVQPVVHHDYRGGEIKFPRNPSLTLSPATCPELLNFIGDTIITAAGDTLLGADDKAGIAEIITMASFLLRHPEFPRPEIRIFITRDEEIGRGVDGIDRSRLPRFCYTIDGGLPGLLECESFDAYGVRAVFHGHGHHPGYAKGKLINAALAASRFAALLNRDESPECTDGRQGFFHVSSLHGDNEEATIQMIVRDFEPKENKRRLEEIEAIHRQIEAEFPGLVIDLAVTHQYSNMREFIARAPEVVEKARHAIADAGLVPKEHPIRGGTDGSRLSEMGHPTPNIFAGGVNFHSKSEWISVSGMTKAVETLLHLARHWADPE